MAYQLRAFFSDHSGLLVINNLKIQHSGVTAQIDHLVFSRRGKHICPKCGAAMVVRKSTRGGYKGGNFWRCSGYPKCKSILRAA